MTPMRLEGSEHFSQTFAHVKSKLSDVAFLVRCQPEVQVIEATPDHAVWSVPAGLTLVPGKLNAELTATNRNETQVFLRILARKLAASAAATAVLTFHPNADGGTSVHWQVELVQVTGLLRMVPHTVIRNGVEGAAPQIWERIRVAI